MSARSMTGFARVRRAIEHGHELAQAADLRGHRFAHCLDQAGPLALEELFHGIPDDQQFGVRLAQPVDLFGKRDRVTGTGKDIVFPPGRSAVR